MDTKPGFSDYFRALFLHQPEDVDRISVGGRALVFVLLAVWGFLFIIHPVDAHYIYGSFLHKPNLVFHEAGHIIFSPFGQFIKVLGGSLFQVLLPLIIMAAFILKNRDGFGASVGLWWSAQNLMDVAPYLYDARDLNLVLLGGVTGKDVVDYHDWEFLLRKLGLVQQAHFLGQTLHWVGALLMLLALVWGGYMIMGQYARLKK